MGEFSRNALAALASILYVGTAVSVSEILRKRRGYGEEFTRKIVHVTVGMWIVPTLFLYTRWYWAAILPAAAIFGNALSLKFKILRGIEREARNDFGTVFFPLSFVICLALFFDGRHNGAAAAVGIIIMALGDASATLYGKARGVHRYTFLGARKSVEGSAAMLVVSAAAAFATLVLFGVGVSVALVVAAVCAAVGTVLEAAGKYGLDNLTVPVSCSLVAHFVLGALEGPLA